MNFTKILGPVQLSWKLVEQLQLSDGFEWFFGLNKAQNIYHSELPLPSIPICNPNIVSKKPKTPEME